MSDYTFPFDTCEKPNKDGIAQPYSALFNLINCIIIFYFLLKTKNNYTFIFLFSIFCFELFHLFSHIVHITGSLQINMSHSSAYLINLSLFYLLYCYTNKIPRYEFIIYILLLICFDIYSFIHLDIVYYLLTQSLIFISFLLYYFTLLPKFIQNSVYQIIFFSAVIIFLFLNELQNCKFMMSIYPDFPYHIFVEIAGIVLFYVISSNFYKL